MGTGVGNVVEAFEFLYGKLLDRDFAKSAGFENYRESDLLHIVRAYLLGYFWKVDPELSSSLPGCSSKVGRIDFCVGDVAIELAVRARGGHKSALCAPANRTEVKKLLRWEGQGVLILFDFGAPPLSETDLNKYRDLPSLGKGKWRTSAFRLAYFHREGRPRKPARIEKTIRVR